jgi:hypothetical protein
MIHQITITGTQYPIKFGYGAFRVLGQKWKCKGVIQTFQKVQELFQGMENLTFEQEGYIGDLVLAGLQNAAPEATLPIKEDVLSVFIFDPIQQQVIMEAITNAMPSAEGNVNPVKAGRKKAKK